MVPYADRYLCLKKKRNTGTLSLEIIQVCGFLVCLLSVFCFSHSWVHHVSLVFDSIKYCAKLQEVFRNSCWEPISNKCPVRCEQTQGVFQIAQGLWLACSVYEWE